MGMGREQGGDADRAPELCTKFILSRQYVAVDMCSSLTVVWAMRKACVGGESMEIVRGRKFGVLLEEKMEERANNAALTPGRGVWAIGGGRP
jgi:hypothetical protein